MTGRRWKVYWGAILFMILSIAAALPVMAESGGISGLEQTGAGSGTVTVAWKRPQDAVQYKIYSSPAGKDDYTAQKSLYAQSVKVSTKVTVSQKTGAGYYDIKIVALDQDGGQVAEEELERCVTAPSKVTGIRQTSRYTSRKMELNWNRQEAAAGYEIETYLYSEKEKRTVKVRSVYAHVPMRQDELYRVRIRGYVEYKAGGRTKRAYGSYGTVYTSLQPRLTFDGGDEHSVIANWKPVAGADSYAVFISRSQKSGYKRVEITQSPTAVLENLKANTRYYVLVRVNKRVKGVLYRSPSTYVYPVRIDTKGNAANTDAGFVLAT